MLGNAFPLRLAYSHNNNNIAWKFITYQSVSWTTNHDLLEALKRESARSLQSVRWQELTAGKFSQGKGGRTDCDNQLQVFTLPRWLLISFNCWKQLVVSRARNGNKLLQQELQPIFTPLPFRNWLAFGPEDDMRKDKLHFQKFKELLLICHLRDARKRNTIEYKIMMTRLWCGKRLLCTVKCHIRPSAKIGLITLCILMWQINPMLFVTVRNIRSHSGVLLIPCPGQLWFRWNWHRSAI